MARPGFSCSDRTSSRFRCQQEWFLSSEASDEEDRLVFSASTTALYRNNPMRRGRHWSRRSIDDGGHAAESAPAIRRRTTPMTAPNGYALHQSVDLGGRIANTTGSGACTTRWSICSPARACWARPSRCMRCRAKRTLWSTPSAPSAGVRRRSVHLCQAECVEGQALRVLGTVPPRPAVLRLRSAGQPEYPHGQSIPIGPSKAPTGSFAWPQVKHSPVMFNTVRRMTDTNLTILPLSKVTYRVGYSQNTLEGPSLSPSGYAIREVQRVASAVSAQQHRRLHGSDRLEARDGTPS